MPFSYPPELRREAIERVRGGQAPVAVAAELGMSWTAVYDWLHADAPELVGRSKSPPCFRCQTAAHDGLAAVAYVHLLGLYLGDGWLLRHPRSWSLNIACDNTYPGLREEARASLTTVSGLGSHLVRRRGCCDIRGYWSHWPCLFPQHGPGKKHQRLIHLETWQWDMVVAHPGALLRGLFHSDGWRGLNVAVKTVDGVRSERRYPRYQFSNRSADIRHLCAAALDLLQIAWRPVGEWTIAVSRREAVAALDEHVGPKY